MSGGNGMTGADPDDVSISYTVKELLRDMAARQAAGFARVEKGLEGKADKADIKRLEERLDRHETRLGTIESKQRADETAAETRGDVSRGKHDQLTRLYLALTALAAVAAVLVTVLR